MRFLSSLATLLAAVLVSSCGGGGGSPGTVTNGQDLFTTAPSALTLTVGNAQHFNVGGGAGPYSATSGDSSVAVAGVTGSDLVVGGVTPGASNVTVRDSKGAISTVAVTVKPARALFTSAPATLTLGIGAGSKQTYTVGGGVPEAGGTPYTVTSSNPGVLSAVLDSSGTSMTLTGLASGAATVTVSDRVGANVTSSVTVTASSGVPMFTTAPGSGIVLNKGASATYSVSGGTPGYTAVSSAVGVATVSPSAITDGTFTVTGVAVGDATVVVRDATGTEKDISVKVVQVPLTVNPSAATALIGDQLLATISGGRAPYTAFVSNVAVADAVILNGNTLQVTVKQQAASVPVVITDADGLTTSFTLTSTPGQPNIQLSPASLIVSDLSTTDITLLVYGANGNVTAFSSDTALLAISSVSGNKVTVSTGSNGNRCVAADTEVIITVVDSTNAQAKSSITVRPSVAATCP
jgi:hypothetical protein